VHKTTIFYLPELVASGFIAVKALNCGFVGLLRKARVLLLRFVFSFCSNPSQVNYHVTSRCSSHTSCAGQFLSRGFVVLLRKIVPQNHNLKTAAELGVMQGKNDRSS
jgi:hypothetical protein